MQIFSISDLHLCLSGAKPMDIFGTTWDNYLEKIKDDWNSRVTAQDVVLMCGDLSWAMKLEEAEEDLKYLNSLNGTKVIIKGNHDYWWKSLTALKQTLPKNIIPIQNNAVKFADYIICGTRGWTVPENAQEQSAEDKKIYDRELIRLELSLKSATSLKQGEEKIIAMIHYPPFNSKLEDSDFTELIKKYNVDKVVYGHLHGKKTRCKSVVKKGNIEYLLTSCDLIENKLIQLY